MMFQKNSITEIQKILCHSNVFISSPQVKQMRRNI